MLLFTFLFVCIRFEPIYSTTYSKERGYFFVFKAPEFSVLNTSGKHLHYHFESNYDFQHNVKLVHYPSKRVIGKKYSKRPNSAYEGKLCIRNWTTKGWSVGTIVQHPQWFATNYSIDFNDYHLSLIKLIALPRTDLIERKDGFRLAQYE